MNLQNIRENAGKFPTALWISLGARGAAIGRLDTALKAAGLTTKGAVRQARLLLASEVYERPVASFRELKDDELWALDQWVLSGQAKEDLPGWLRQRP